MKAGVVLTIYIGQFGERREQVAVPVSEALLYELSEPQELSDSPFSLMLAGNFRGDMFAAMSNTVERRKRVFKMREHFADEIAKAVKRALIAKLGDKDKTDGYSKE
jgi:ABC-type thiamine transport system ATPase subunit